MVFIDNIKKSKSAKTLCTVYAKQIPSLAAGINALLAEHGIKDMEIHSFSFGKGAGLVSSKDPSMVAGVGTTKEGVYVTGMYEK